MTLYQDFKIDDKIEDSLRRNNIPIPEYNIFDNEKEK